MLGVLLVGQERFSGDTNILADLAHLQDQPSKVGSETALERVRRAIWGNLNADNACIVSRSPRGLEQMMAVFVYVFGAFGLAISESKTETTCMLIPRAPATNSTPRDNSTARQPISPIWEAASLKPRTYRTADPCGVDEFQALHAGAVRPPEGKSAAPEGPDGAIRDRGISCTDERHGLPLRATTSSSVQHITGCCFGS